MPLKVRAVECLLLALLAGSGCEGLSTSPGEGLYPDLTDVPGCRSGQPDRLCIGLHYVTYIDSAGDPVLTSEEIQRNVDAVNRIWDQCNVAFEVERYEPVWAADLGLRYQLRDYSELSDVRITFADSSTLLIVATGAWDRTGSLGTTGANAWTAMPGGGPFGIVMERPVATLVNMIAHELGHYLGLFHVANVTSLMNPVIYPFSQGLTTDECDNARSVARSFWSKMLR